ncbi:hypothetical protein F5877DRAFT_64905 [Lentinula edodes]|nr:hypothetical protein F5877DRAFT_64905 [Lentinula edodes]
MSDTSANHPPAVVKPKRGRKPKNKPRTEEENNALAKLMSDWEAMKVSQAARDVENARLNAELVALHAYRSTVLSETRIGQQTISPMPVEGTSSTPGENFDAQAGPNNTQVGSQPNENNFQDRRQALESLTNLQANQHEDSTTVTTEKNIPSSEDLPVIPKPKGQAGRDFTLCVKMGLSKSTKGLVTYNALVQNTHRAVHESRIPWDKYEWRNIAAADKALLFTIMRECDPILKRFEMD